MAHDSMVHGYLKIIKIFISSPQWHKSIRMCKSPHLFLFEIFDCKLTREKSTESTIDGVSIPFKCEWFSRNEMQINKLTLLAKYQFVVRLNRNSPPFTKLNNHCESVSIIAIF